MNDPNEKVEFIFDEIFNYHQVGKSYLGFDIAVRDPTAWFNNNTKTGLVNIGFAHCLKEASLATTEGMEIELVKFLGQFSTNRRILSSKDGDLLSYFFDNINEDSKNNDSLNDRLINSHIVAVNRGKIKRHLKLEDVFGFSKTFKTITKNLGFHLTI